MPIPEGGAASAAELEQEQGADVVSKDLYELLGVQRQASAGELRRSYETALARASRDGATAYMLELVRAFEVLGDASRRRLYDQTGMVIARERVPNIHGMATGWRGGSLGLGAGRRAAVVSARPVVPCRQPSHVVRWAAVGKVLLGIGLAGTLAVGATTSYLQHKAAATPARPAPAPGVTYVCRTASAGHSYSFTAPAGIDVACGNGAKPRKA